MNRKARGKQKKKKEGSNKKKKVDSPLSMHLTNTPSNPCFFFSIWAYKHTNRLLLQHYVIRYAFGSNIIAPIDTSIAGKVLDCACGPGTWVMVRKPLVSFSSDVAIASLFGSSFFSFLPPLFFLAPMFPTGDGDRV